MYAPGARATRPPAYKHAHRYDQRDGGARARPHARGVDDFQGLLRAPWTYTLRQGSRYVFTFSWENEHHKHKSGMCTSNEHRAPEPMSNHPSHWWEAFGAGRRPTHQCPADTCSISSHGLPSHVRSRESCLHIGRAVGVRADSARRCRTFGIWYNGGILYHQLLAI